MDETIQVANYHAILRCHDHDKSSFFFANNLSLDIYQKESFWKWILTFAYDNSDQTVADQTDGFN